MPNIIRIPVLIAIFAAIGLLWYRSKRPAPQFSLLSRLAYSRTAFSKLGERVRDNRITREFPELLDGIRRDHPVADTGPELMSREALEELRMRELRHVCEICGIDHTGECEDDEDAMEPTAIIPAVLIPGGELEPLPPQPEIVHQPSGAGYMLSPELSALLPSWYEPRPVVQPVQDGYEEAEREHMAALLAALKSGLPYGDIVPPYIHE